MKKLLASILLMIAGLFGTPLRADAQNDNVVILDVRTPQEYQETHVIGSQNIDFKNPNFQTQIDKLDRSKTYKLYCRSGNRSGQALEIMKKMGFKDLENLGSVKQASDKLKVACEGEKPC